ncbi:MAG: hypothetical protein HY482_01310 [Candidatus Wildermuthbacteria bacterium]|nr:hypothetical protein [Candidatus Wildermuthbacteria bacterium]
MCYDLYEPGLNRDQQLAACPKGMWDGRWNPAPRARGEEGKVGEPLTVPVPTKEDYCAL